MALPTIEQVLASPATHYWLKDALQSALTKDAVDAFYDADLLAKLLRARLDSILGMHRDESGNLLTSASVSSEDRKHANQQAAIKAFRTAPEAPYSRIRGEYVTNVYSRRIHRSA